MTKTMREAFSGRGVKAVRSFGPVFSIENAPSSWTISATDRAVSVRRCEWWLRRAPNM